MIAIANTLPVVPKAGRALRFLMPLILALVAASLHAALPGSPEEVTEAEKAVVKTTSKSTFFIWFNRSNPVSR